MSAQNNKQQKRRKLQTLDNNTGEDSNVRCDIIDREALLRKHSIKQCYVRLESVNPDAKRYVDAVPTHKKQVRNESGEVPIGRPNIENVEAVSSNVQDDAVNAAPSIVRHDEIAREALLRKYNIKQCYVRLESVNPDAKRYVDAVPTHKKRACAEGEIAIVRHKVPSNAPVNAVPAIARHGEIAQEALLREHNIKQCYVRLERVKPIAKSGPKSTRDLVKFLPIEAPIKIPSLIKYK